MKHVSKISLYLILAAFGATLLATQSGVSAEPQAPGNVVALARRYFNEFQRGKVDRRRFDQVVNAQLTDSMIQHEASILKPYGRPRSMLFIRSERIGYATGYEFRLLFKSGMIIESIAFDPDGMIAGIDFRTFARASS